MGAFVGYSKEELLLLQEELICKRENSQLNSFINVGFLIGLVFVLIETFRPTEPVESIELTNLAVYLTCCFFWWNHLQKEKKTLNKQLYWIKKTLSTLDDSTTTDFKQNSSTQTEGSMTQRALVNQVTKSVKTKQELKKMQLRLRSSELSTHLLFLILGVAFFGVSGLSVLNGRLSFIQGLLLLMPSMMIIFALHRCLYKAQKRKNDYIRRALAKKVQQVETAKVVKTN